MRETPGAETPEEAAPEGGITFEVPAGITRVEYLQAQRAHRLTWNYFLFLGILLSLLYLVFCSLFSVLEVTIAFVFVIPLLAVFLGFVAPWSWGRTYSKAPSLRISYRARLSEEGLESWSELGEVKAPWKVFIKWKESKDLFLLYSQPNLFQMLPKRALTRPEDAEEVRALLSRLVR